ncbi:MAG: CBS domain-containing protein [Planctomycetes bacterium]|nr:CBS domain-containing protein [Planctomycetota bacterium]
MGWAQRRARDVMTSPVKSIERGATLDEVVQRLADEGVTGLLVVDRGGRPVGVVSHADVVSYVAGLERGLTGAGSFYFQSEPRADRISSGPPVNLDSVDDDALRATDVDAVMTPEVIWVPDGARLPEVARTMVERGIHRVLVEQAGAVVGIVSTLDVLRALTAEAAPRAAAKKRPAQKRPGRKTAAPGRKTRA